MPGFDGQVWVKGLTLKEYAAIMALKGLLSDSKSRPDPGTAAQQAIGYADQLLAELERREQV